MKLKLNNNYKFGVQVPLCSTKELFLHDKNNHQLWEKVIRKEIKEIDSLNTSIIQELKENIPNDLKFIPVHLVLDVKYYGRRKARLVAVGHLTHQRYIQEYYLLNLSD